MVNSAKKKEREALARELSECKDRIRQLSKQIAAIDGENDQEGICHAFDKHYWYKILSMPLLKEHPRTDYNTYCGYLLGKVHGFRDAAATFGKSFADCAEYESEISDLFEDESVF